MPTCSADNDNDLRSSFANNVNNNDNVNVKDNVSDNDSVNDNDNFNDNDNVNDNFMYIYLMKNIKGVNLSRTNIREQTPSVANQAVSATLVTIFL